MTDDKTLEFSRLLRYHAFVHKRDWESVFFLNLIRDFCQTVNEIQKNPDDRFVKSLKHLSFPYHDENRIDSIFLRLYVIIKGYEYQKDNYDDFEALVGDLTYLTCMPQIDLSITNFNATCELIDNILKNKNYKELLGHRNFLRDMCLCFGNENTDKTDFIAFYNEKLVVFEDAKKLGFDEEHARKIFDRLILPNNYSNKTVYFCKEYFYDKILLYGDRFEYFNDKLQAIEKNNFIKKEIFLIVRNLSVALFNELNVSSTNDSFKTCMNSVFNSDSYLELSNKLNLLIKSSKLYETGKKEEAFSLLKKINDSELKKVYRGEIVSYLDNNMNKVNKPNTILEREINLCSEIGHPNDFYDVKYKVLHSKSLCEAIRKFQYVGNPLVFSFNKLKSKLMRK